MHNNSSVPNLKTAQHSTEKRNISSLKKYNSPSATKKHEKCQHPLSDLSGSDSIAENTYPQSPSSTSPSTYNKSYFTNDAISLQYADGSLASNVSLHELKQKFNELYANRNKLQSLLNKKLKEAIELSKEEFAMTCKIPSDHKLLDPTGDVCFTNNPLPSRLLDPANQNEKNLLLLQIETLTNIYEVLRQTPKSEKKLKKELDLKIQQINSVKNQLSALEKQRAFGFRSLNHCRSNSVMHINRISSSFSGNDFSNNNVSNYQDIQSNLVPYTAPVQRKFNQLQIIAGIRNESDSIAFTDQCSRKPIWKGPLLHCDHNYNNTNNFQRFTSARTAIKISSSQRPKLDLSQTENLETFVDTDDSISSGSNCSSIGDFEIVVNPLYDSSLLQTENESSHMNNNVDLRQLPTVYSRIINCRDSMEVNHDRLKQTHYNYSQQIISKSKQKARQSISLQDLREEFSLTNSSRL